ncbi:Ubiquitin carboxyl-terminal hydrolase 37 [Merluccius polli]|uniref:Ubiquitin carboxyl-terminal hydrolase 37 n=1 Tax=Merluccius polli TaxID=89951 RepID=A0AA47NV97_MERPO|nr:Ubiquitin carboxyl-terminal hydrolase 37 [Merluccius polli]
MDARTPQGDIKGDGVQAGPSIDGALVQGAVSQSGGVLNSLPTLPPLTEQQLDFLGLPNLGQSCYLNSRPAESPDPGGLQDFVAIKASRHSGDLDHKTALLRSFKKSIALQDPEFMDNGQKDAHEFLICVLNQVWTLSPLLKSAALRTLGRTYTCPVETHLLFHMLSTRTCKGCDGQSSSKEAFTNLSLWTWSLKAHSLEYTCQCGAKESGMRPCFLTLPNVLVLHLKRFRFTLTGRLEKVADRVLLSRELELSCGTGTVALSQSCSKYHIVLSSVSVFCTHEDITSVRGPIRARSNDLEDQWLCYNDLNVSQTTGRAVRRHRQRTAYLLFYQRQALCRLPQKFCYNIMGLLAVEQSGVRGWTGPKGLGWDFGGQTNITFRRPRAPRDHRKTQIGPVAARIGPATCQVQAGRARVSEVGLTLHRRGPSPGGCIPFWRLPALPPLTEQQLDFLGLPNLGQSCYLNSALQSLLTLGVFSEEIEQMQWAWSSLASAELLRDFVAVRASRRSGDLNHKLAVLRYHFRPQRHYISEGAYQDEANDLEDQWLCYNDLNVSQTTGRAVHRHRQRTAYVLFYQ